MHNLDDELATFMVGDEFSPPKDKLDALTDKMRETRDIKFDLQDLEEKMKEKKARLNQLIHKELPDGMAEVAQTGLRLPQEGNYPPFEFKLKPFYKANIDNESPVSLQAYQWLENHGEGDIIKRTITAPLGRESGQIAEQIAQFLEQIDVPYEMKFGVPWNTLTSWLKERHKQYIKQQQTDVRKIPYEDRIEMPPLDLFGAVIGQYVDIKESK